MKFFFHSVLFPIIFLTFVKTSKCRCQTSPAAFITNNLIIKNTKKGLTTVPYSLKTRNSLSLSEESSEPISPEVSKDESKKQKISPRKMFKSKDSRIKMFQYFPLVFIFWKLSLIAGTLDIIELAPHFPFWAATSLFPILSASTALTSAAENERLRSNTYKRLMLAFSSLMGCLSLTLLGSFNMIAPTYLVISSGLLGFGSAVYLKIWVDDCEKSVQSEFFEGTVGSFRNMIGLKNIPSAIYSFFTVSFLVDGLLKVIFSEPWRYMMELDNLYIRLIGLSSLFFSCVMHTLKDAADRDRLGGSTFKVLNLGLSATSFARVALLLQFGSFFSLNTLMGLIFYSICATTCYLQA